MAILATRYNMAELLRLSLVGYPGCSRHLPLIVSDKRKTKFHRAVEIRAIRRPFSYIRGLFRVRPFEQNIAHFDAPRILIFRVFFRLLRASHNSLSGKYATPTALWATDKIDLPARNLIRAFLEPPCPLSQLTSIHVRR